MSNEPDSPAFVNASAPGNANLPIGNFGASARPANSPLANPEIGVPGGVPSEDADAPALARTDARRFLSDEARGILRAAIEEIGGDEVFFVGTVDEAGLVIDVEPCAYGNREAVPVIESLARPGSVVLHNHPSGDLQPSQADLEVAARFGGQGVGSYIIDNDVTQVRVIVKCLKPRQAKPLDVAQLEQMLGPDGALARSMRAYEHRPQQGEMLRLVTAAFNDEGIAVIEAGTGTGKSLAYLVPALHWARANGEKVVVSTNTINLQEQLIAKDLPFLQKHLGVEFTAVLMKGRNNYLCRRKASFVAATPDFFADERIVGQLQALLEWARQTKNGSLSDLNFLPDDEVWEQLSCDADNCTRVRCMHYADCFFYQARRQAAAADLIVANHHLVMADLAVRLESNNQTTAAVLPPYRRIIFDEAHNIEDVATQYFGLRITRRTLSRLLHRLIHRERPGQGLLPFVHGRLVMLAYELGTPALNDAVALIENELMPLRGELAVSLGSLLDLCARGVLDMTGERLAPRREVQLRITDVVTESHFWQQDLRRALGEATDRMARLVAGLRKVDEAIGKLPDKPRESFQDPAGELRSIGNRLAARLNDLRSFYTVGENQCRWIEVRQPPGNGSPSVQLVSLPLDVRAPLNAAIYNHAKTVVMTSATLTVDRRFDFFLDQVGLASEHAEPDTRRRITTLQLDTPFDFDRQAFVGVPIDLPDPLDRLFDEAATALLLPMLQASGGSAFVLFTSYRQLNGFYDRLARPLESMGYTCLRQGDENRQNLLKRFQADRSSILFATSSFWEGVDVPGDALRMLVLVKLPFRVPSDPLMQARVERIQAQGLDAFTEYALPHAVIRFKQGFGRLIRTRDDYGAVLLLDRRLVTKPYGRVFLNSLPARTIHRKPAQHLLEDLTTFFEERR